MEEKSSLLLPGMCAQPLMKKLNNGWRNLTRITVPKCLRQRLRPKARLNRGQIKDSLCAAAVAIAAAAAAAAAPIEA